MEIQFKSHHADITDGMRERAERALRKLGARLPRAVDSVVRFERDGRARRVEILVRAPGRRTLVAEGTAERFPSALSAAVQRLDQQTRESKRPSRRSQAETAGRV
ncbi:MAG TPA: HPF/RaiA family ribosome-associated protein [Gemmatimonadaceae bacterium]|nr:HPF/RaiA family ribosome-associated protein [Gemmatimonadaceae bacterium]